MFIYDQSADHDLLVAQWWAEAVQSGELSLFIAEGGRSLSAFFRLFAPPNTLLFETDGERIIYAAWFEPCLRGAFYALYIHPLHRNDVRSGLKFIHATYEFGFRFWPVLVGWTKQQRLLDSHAKLGYNYLGAVPHLFDGEDCHILYLTREAWEKNRGSR